MIKDTFLSSFQTTIGKLDHSSTRHVWTILIPYLSGTQMFTVIYWVILIMFYFFAAYTQIITLTVYTYLCSHLFGRQFLEPKVGTILKPEDQFVLLTFSKWPFINAPTCRIVIRPILVRTYHNSFHVTSFSVFHTEATVSIV